VQKSRQSLTKQLSELTTKSPIDCDTAIEIWWWNKYNGSSFRLTVPGLITFTNELALASYNWKLAEPLRVTPQILLKLDRKLESPYFIRFGGKKEMFIHELILFAEKEATYLNLIDNLEKFLDNL
jgi:hypothetical protein